MQDVSIYPDQWTDMNTVVYNTPVSDFITIQNKITDKVIVYIGSESPVLATPSEGIILETEDIRTFKLSDGLFIRSTTCKGFISISNPNEFGESPTTLPSGYAPLDFENKQSMNTVFGEQIVAQHSDSINIQFQYNISTWDVKPTQTGTGSTFHSAPSRAAITCGTGVGSAKIESINAVRYVAGKEMFANFTASFPTKEPNVKQFIGIIDEDNGFAVGYNGTQLCMLHRSQDVDVLIPEESFNMKPEGLVLDFTGIHIFKISYGWLGVAPAILSVYQGFEKGWVALHAVDYTNEATPHIQNPVLPVSAFVERTSGSGSAVTMYTSSWRAGILGTNGTNLSTDRTFQRIVRSKVISGGNVLNPVFSIRNKSTFKGIINHVNARYGTVTISSDGNKPVVITVYKSGTITGGTWNDYDVDNSVCQYNITMTSFTPVDVNTPIGGTVLGKVDTTRINLFNNDVIISILPNETLTLCADSSLTSEITLFIRHIESF